MDTWWRAEGGSALSASSSAWRHVQLRQNQLFDTNESLRSAWHCFLQVEIKPDMVGHYLAEFSISYKPVKHGKPGIGATHSSRFIPLK